MSDDARLAETPATSILVRWLPARVRSVVVRFLPPGAVLLSTLSFGYFVMGQLRNRTLANQFGLGAELDVYQVAFRIPEVALDVLVAAGLTAPFVPIFSSLRHDDERAANDFARTVLTAAVLVMIVAMGILILLAPAIADQVGGNLDTAGRSLYVDLFRINCLGQILFAASIAIGEVLVANRRFLFYALAPILYTSGIVAGTVLAGDQLGIYAPAWGAVAGAGAHLAIRAVGTFQTSFRIRPQLRIRTPAFREFVRLMLPRMASYPIDPILLTFFGVLALSFGTGRASALAFADDYRVVPVILIAQQFSLAVFPALSTAYTDGDRTAFRSILRRNLVTIGGLTLVAAIGLALIAPLLIDILLGGGEFGTDDVALTAGLLIAFAFSVPLDSLSYPLSRALYATHNTALQVVASVCAFATIVAVALVIAPLVGIVSIPIAYAIGSGVKVVLLAVFVTRRLASVDRADAHPTAAGPA
ncbi:MAG TPA: lipid II flippase MurJ [Candidatus Limnocylindrales bacterium]|nr:lipid II flippase MurJ [Candidatus Limnocylindrales bacterium]